jgi:hypothetical protein
MQVFAGLTLLLKTESYVGANIWSNNYNDINDPTLAETTYGSSKRLPEGTMLCLNVEWTAFEHAVSASSVREV